MCWFSFIAIHLLALNMLISDSICCEIALTCFPKFCCVNETVLHWVHADVKTCHKCESMEHLVIECQEKKIMTSSNKEEMAIIEFIQGTGYQTTKT